MAAGKYYSFRMAAALHDKDKCCAVVGNGARCAVELIVDEMDRLGWTVADFAGLVHENDGRGPVLPGLTIPPKEAGASPCDA